jgi:hypothetical protein
MPCGGKFRCARQQSFHWSCLRLHRDGRHRTFQKDLPPGGRRVAVAKVPTLFRGPEGLIETMPSGETASCIVWQEAPQGARR